MSISVTYAAVFIALEKLEKGEQKVAEFHIVERMDGHKSIGYFSVTYDRTEKPPMFHLTQHFNEAIVAITPRMGSYFTQAFSLKHNLANTVDGCVLNCGKWCNTPMAVQVQYKNECAAAPSTTSKGVGSHALGS